MRSDAEDGDKALNHELDIVCNVGWISNERLRVKKQQLQICHDRVDQLEEKVVAIFVVDVRRGFAQLDARHSRCFGELLARTVRNEGLLGVRLKVFKF